MEQTLTNLTAAATSARLALVSAAFVEPRNDAEIRSRMEALRAAEQALAQNRASGFAQIQGTPDRLTVAQAQTLVQQASRGAGNRIGAAAVPPRVMEELLQPDFPIQGACISAPWPNNNVALKGLAIRVGNSANVLFDTDLCRMAAGWTGGYITTRGLIYDGAHAQHPAINGDQKFGTSAIPGIGGADGTFTDNRSEPFGPIDKTVAHWKGLYVTGPTTTLSYTARGTQVYEQPGSFKSGEEVGFTRSFRLAPAQSEVQESFGILLAEVQTSNPRIGTENGQPVVIWNSGEQVTKIIASGLPSGATLITKESRAYLSVSKGVKGGDFTITLWNGPAAAMASYTPPPQGSVNFKDFSKGGPAHWPVKLVGKGELNTSETPDGAYVTDRISVPAQNPWNRRVRLSGFDFFSDGTRAAFCTHDGDIWIVSGVDATLQNLEWRRFASGLYEPLGLLIVNDVIYTSSRDGITRYYDLNNDGEADHYENFNNDIMSSEGFHEFVFDLQRDAAGNFYFAKANPVNSGGRGFGNLTAARANGTVSSHSGAVFRLSADGSKLEVIARGFRAPNGLAVRADGQITTSDNEGTWVPSTPINWVDGKTFHGVINNLTSPELADRWAPPLTWISHSDYDNSGGSQVWVTSDQWGPFKGELLHESYGKSSLFLVLKEQLPSGRMQGGVVRFPLKFTSSAMRARFNAKDGQLYVAGLSEWQSNAANQTGFDRIRYTGKPVYSVRSMNVVPGGVQFSFTEPVDKASAEDLQNWSGKRWNYIRSENYGSPERQVKDPNVNGRETLEITSSKLAADAKTVTLTISDFRPVMQESIQWNIKAKDGTAISQETQHTIHEVPTTR